MELVYKSFCSSVRTPHLTLQGVDLEKDGYTLHYPPSHFEQLNQLYGTKFPPTYLWSTKNGELGETAIFTLT